MIQARLVRGNSSFNNNEGINVNELPNEIRDSFAKTKLKSLLTDSLQPLVYYFKSRKDIVLDIINISDNISDNVEINKFVGLVNSETLCRTLGSMIYSEISRTCNYLMNKYGDDLFYDDFLNEVDTQNIASVILGIICK